MADALKLRVTQGNLTHPLSPQGPRPSAVQLTVEVVEKSSLRVNLPKDAKLFSAFVNEESVNVVREDDAYLLNVSPNTGRGSPRQSTARVFRARFPGLRHQSSLASTAECPSRQCLVARDRPARLGRIQLQGKPASLKEKKSADSSVSTITSPLSTATRNTEAKKAAA